MATRLMILMVFKKRGMEHLWDSHAQSQAAAAKGKALLWFAGMVLEGCWAGAVKPSQLPSLPSKEKDRGSMWQGQGSSCCGYRTSVSLLVPGRDPGKVCLPVRIWVSCHGGDHPGPIGLQLPRVGLGG